jgi:uncharacterized protein (TIGR03545 family)
MNDVRRLRDKYSLSPAGLANMTQALFGGELSSKIRSGLHWYNRLKPLYERAGKQKGPVKVVKPIRGRGMNVRFKEYRPLPDFLIARTAVSAETTVGVLAGTITDITPDQDVLGKPLRFSFSGEKLNAARKIECAGILDHMVPARPRDSARFSVSGYQLRDLVLSQRKNLPVSVESGLLDLNLDGLNANGLKADFLASIKSAKLKAGADKSAGLIGEAIKSSLSRVSDFSLKGNLSGTLENYKLSISSDLDRVLKASVSGVVQEQAAKLEQQLKTAVSEKTGPRLAALQDDFGGLKSIGGGIDDMQNQLDALLKDALASAGGGKLRLRR